MTTISRAATTTPRRILFVDDEPSILDGLRRLLRPMRQEWELSFAPGGEEALALMERSPIDVIVTDMRMPIMDGAQLLSAVRTRFPDVIRIVLSGHSDQELVVRSINAAHQYLSKPCDVSVLKERIGAACALRDLLTSVALGGVASKLSALPSLPRLYQEISSALAQDASASDIGEIVSRDVAMSAKVLQLVNSSFFGRTLPTASPHQAVVFLGVETIRALVLSAHVFSRADRALVTEFGLEDLWQHSFRVSVLARTVAATLHASRQEVDQAGVAGFLHEAGRVVLATQVPAEYRAACLRASDGSRPLPEAEAETIGASSASVGAYLLGVWGLPGRIVEAVAWHERPSAGHPGTSAVLTAVHVANVLDRGAEPAPGLPSVAAPELDVDYLQRAGCSGGLSNWQLLLNEAG